MRDMSRVLASFAFAMACLALGLRVATPPGFMIAAPQGERGAAVVICTGQGPLAAAPAAPDAPSPPAHDGDHHGPCIFAGVGPALAGGPAVVLGEAVYRPVALELAPRMTSRPGAGLSAPPPPQTGPPSLA